MTPAGKTSPDLSVVVPVYRGERFLEELYSRVEKVAQELRLSFELILVNDMSPDRSWEIIRKLCSIHPQVKGLDLSRNFGQHHAITAGLDAAAGEWVVVMDCDLQDQPEEIAKLYARAQEGFDIVFARREERQDKFSKRITSLAFHHVYRYFTTCKIDHRVANFSIARKIVIRNWCRLREQTRVYPLFIDWMGFRTGFVDVAHAARAGGGSSYTLRKLFILAGDIIIAQSNKPLKFSIALGIFSALVAFCLGVFFVYRYFVFGIPVQGWASIAVSLWFALGLILGNLGIIGLYIGKIFNETKARPLYIVREALGYSKESDPGQFGPA